MLRVRDLHAFYGFGHVLHGVSFDIAAGEIVTLLGRNGAGRSTTARAIMGLLRWQGQILWQERSLHGCRPFDIARRGIGYVPESRDIFPALSVHENLLLGQKRRYGATATGRTPWSLNDMYRLFEPLRERQHLPAGVLSGGEQQMLALCRTLMGNPELVLVDEPTEGLAPALVVQVGELLRDIRRRGASILLIEQRCTLALEISDRVLVMGRGAIVFDGTPASLRGAPEVREQWLEP